MRDAGVSGAPEPVGIALKKSNAALKTAVNQALLQLKPDGTYAKISPKWFGQDVSKP